MIAKIAWYTFDWEELGEGNLGVLETSLSSIYAGRVFYQIKCLKKQENRLYLIFPKVSQIYEEAVKAGAKYYAALFHISSIDLEERCTLIFTGDLRFPKASRYKLINFDAQRKTDLLAENLGITPQEGPVSLCQKYGSKWGSKKVFEACGIKTPVWSQTSGDTLETLTEMFEEMKQKQPQEQPLVFKLSYPGWAGGFGNIILDSNEDFSAQLERGCNFRELSGDIFYDSIREHGAIIEKWVSDVVCSPSVQGRITEKGVQILATHVQILDEHSEYEGCYFPASSHISLEKEQKIKEMTLQVGRYLFSKRVRGSFGVDYIIDQAGEIFAVEINLRKSATFSPNETVRVLFRNKRNEPGSLQERATLFQGNPRAYVNWRITIPKGQTLEIIQEKITSYAYNQETGCGVIINAPNGIPFRYLEVTAIAPNLEEAERIQGVVKEALLRK